MDYDLGFFDEMSGQFEPGANPFGSKVLPIDNAYLKSTHFRLYWSNQEPTFN